MTRTTLYLPEAGRSPDARKVMKKVKAVIVSQDDENVTPVDKSGQVMFVKDMLHKSGVIVNSAKKAANLSRLENETKSEDKGRPTTGEIKDETN